MLLKTNIIKLYNNSLCSIKRKNQKIGISSPWIRMMLGSPAHLPSTAPSHHLRDEIRKSQSRRKARWKKITKFKKIKKRVKRRREKDEKANESWATLFLLELSGAFSTWICNNLSRQVSVYQLETLRLFEFEGDSVRQTHQTNEQTRRQTKTIDHPTFRNALKCWKITKNAWKWYISGDPSQLIPETMNMTES